MTRKFRARLACLAVGVVATVGLSGAFATTAVADDRADAPTSGAAFDAYAKEVLAADEVQAVATDGAGNVVLYTTEPVAEIADEQARALAATPDNVVVKQIGGPLTAYATDEIVGGAGYAAAESFSSEDIGLCSVGFSAWSAEGDPAIVSAGHCTSDNTKVVSALTLPTGDPAGGGASDNGDVEFVAPLGELAFSQFGGPGNSAGTVGDVTSVDVSVYDVLNADLSTLPEVTNWTTSASEDLAAGTLPVRSVGTAAVGQAVSKSGRTTGFTSGTVDAVNGWADVSGRQVYGFMSVLESLPGDSGGAVIQGDRAVGVLSGGAEQDGVSWTWSADLQAGLALTGGYTVALYLDTPQLAGIVDGGEVYSGAPITGTGPAGTTLEVTPEEGEPFEVAINAEGGWSFAAPAETGVASYSVSAVRGFDRSAATSFSVDVLPAPLAAPVITSPANGTVVETELTSISGTGLPGATVELSGAVEESVLVSGAGTWSVDAELGYGTYSVSAVQTRVAGDTSPVATSAFAVAPVAPVITAPAGGASFTQGSGPTSVSGTGIDGAVVNVAINGVSAGTTTVVDGVWSIRLTEQLAAGTVSITASQTINGATGSAATSTITIAAAAAAAGTPGSALASTGVSPVLPISAAALALLLGAGALFVARRRSASGQRG